MPLRLRTQDEALSRQGRHSKASTQRSRRPASTRNRTWQEGTTAVGPTTLTVSKSMNRRGDLVALKGRKRQDQGRTILMPPDLAERIRRHLAASTLASIDGLMFTAAKGGPIRYTGWRTRRRLPIAKLARVDATPHDLRHTTATRLMQMDRWGPSELQAFLGRSDPRVTLKIYTQITSRDLPTPSALTSPD